MDNDEDIVVFSNEINVKDRCQKIGISLDNVRHRIGPDRFKWLALINMLRLRENHVELFDDESIDFFFQYVIYKIPDFQHKNPLACVLVYYTCISYDLKFHLDQSRLDFVQKILIPEKELLFQGQGLKFIDLIRYIRLFKSIF